MNSTITPSLARRVTATAHAAEARPGPWTAADANSAYDDGWVLANVDGTSFREIQRVDETEVFPDDAMALSHVKQRANGPLGSLLHKRALAICEGNTVARPAV